MVQKIFERLREIFVRRPRGIVLALGGGGAAGLAHIGVLDVLAEHHIPVRAIVGTSIGAEVGAFYAAGTSLADLIDIATGFDWKQTLRLFFPDLPTGGLVSGDKIANFLRRRLRDRRIEDLPIGFAAIATDLNSGEQVVMDRGDLVDAVRASVSIPGLIAPLALGGRTLVDGGVINPLPFDVARQRFGGPVVAVAVHASARGLAPMLTLVQTRLWVTRAQQLLDQPWMTRAPGLRDWLKTWLGDRSADRAPKAWTTRRVLDRATDIGQAEIVRLRMHQRAPELMLSPKVGGIGMLEFYRGAEAIAAGRAAVREKLEDIRRLVRRSE